MKVEINAKILMEIPDGIIGIFAIEDYKKYFKKTL